MTAPLIALSIFALLAMTAGLPLPSPPAFAGSSLKVAGGRVREAEVEKQELVLTYFHPVTRREEDLVLHVGDGTGFSEGLEFEELQPGDPVSVDYEEGSGEKAQAVLIKRVPIRGVPKNLSR